MFTGTDEEIKAINILSRPTTVSGGKKKFDNSKESY